MKTMNHHQLKPMLVALLAVGLLLLPTSSRAQVPPEVEVRIAPMTVEVAAGEAADVAIEVVDVHELYATDLTLTFDPQTIQIQDANPGLAGVQVALGLFLDPGFVLINDVDNENGILRFAMTQLNPSEAKSGTGALIVMQVRGGDADSSSRLSLDDAKLARGDGTAIQSAPVSGRVEVTTSPATGATLTPLPRQSPGTPMPTLTATMTPVATTPAPSPTPTRTSLAVTDSPTSATATPAPTKLTPPDPTRTAQASESVVGVAPGAAVYEHDATGVTPQPAATVSGQAEVDPTSEGAAQATPGPDQTAPGGNAETQPASTPGTIAPANPEDNEVAMAESPDDGEAPTIPQAKKKLNPALLLLLIAGIALGIALLLGVLAVAILVAARRAPST